LPLADFSGVCPLAGVLRPSGLAAGRRPGPSCRALVPRQRIPQRLACPALKSITCSVLSSPKQAVPSLSASLLMRCRKGQRVVRMVSDSDPRTLAENVRHCPKIFVR
jgi:hypothetical protein